MPYLYEIPRNSKIYEQTINSEGKVIGKVIIFHHTDGMYSYCTVPDTDEFNVVHLSVMTPLRKFRDGYKIDDKKTTNTAGKVAKKS